MVPLLGALLLLPSGPVLLLTLLFFLPFDLLLLFLPSGPVLLLALLFLLPSGLLPLFLLCGLVLLLALLFLLPLGLLSRVFRLSLLLLVPGLGRLFLFLLLLLLCVCRSNHSEKQEQARCADHFKQLHRRCLHCCDSMSVLAASSTFVVSALVTSLGPTSDPSSVIELTQRVSVRGNETVQIHSGARTPQR